MNESSTEDSNTQNSSPKDGLDFLERLSKSDTLQGSNIITIGRIDTESLSARYVPAASLWTLTPGNYPLSSEQVKVCTGIRFQGDLLLTQNFMLGSILVYQISNEIGSHVIVIRPVNADHEDRAIYCNSFNTTCYILRQYGIPFAEIYRKKVIEPDQVLNTNLNKSLLQSSYNSSETKILDLNWGTEYYPTLYAHASNFIATEENAYTKYEGRLINIGPISTKVLLTLNDELVNPDLEHLSNILEIQVDEKDALEFLGCSITDNKYFIPLIQQIKQAGKKEYDFSTFNIDFFAVYIKLNLEEDRPTITRMVLAPDMTILENYLYHGYNPDHLGAAVDSII